jgi:predicted dehydrogenase
MDKIRIGMIGVGQIGKQHCANYAKLAGAEMVAVADLDEAEARRVAAQYQIADVTTDFRQLLKRQDIQAVDVCLHNNLHAPVTIEALRAGKHVYCEKPIAGAFVDGKAMFDEAAKCGRNLSIQLSTLFVPEAKVAKRLVDAGRLGRIYHARSTGYRRRNRPFVDGYGTPAFVQKQIAAGGALIDMGVYHISQILYLVGRPKVERISGKVYQETGMDPKRREASGYNVEELGLGFVKCAGGFTLDILESWAIHLNEFDGSCIVGSEGGIRLEPFGYYTTLDDVESDVTFDLKHTDWRWHQCNPDEEAYDSAQGHWVAALQGRVPLIPTSEIALATMLISEGIYLSDRLGREVTPEEVLANSKSTAVKV